MKEITRRTLIVFWLAAIAVIAYNVFRWGLFDLETWQISALFAMPLWALQFILTGVVNPFALIHSKDRLKTLLLGYPHEMLSSKHKRTLKTLFDKFSHLLLANPSFHRTCAKSRAGR
jgi:hypothetical protein